ncbi:MAG: COG4705 family protein [Trebonia sp.]
MLNKVPEVTLYFWVIKVLSTTVGETAADFLDTNLNLGLTTTSLIMTALLVVALVAQVRVGRYVAGVYWVTVVLVSIVGTLITDNLSDGYNVPLAVSTPVFAVLLALTFTGWFAVERTLSIHSIFTRRRECFYWTTVLFTFALGTAAGDLISEKVNLGYWVALGLFAAAIGVVILARLGLRVDAIACFWVAYVLTRPLGASLGDLLSQPKDAGGLGLGTTATSFLFLAAIVVLVGYLTVSKRDVSAEPAEGF